MPLKSAIHLRLKEAGEFLHNNVKINSFPTLLNRLFFIVQKTDINLL